MSKLTKVYSQQLGMSLGKAAHKLRQSILFNLAKECNKLNCYRCNELIESVDEFSIEHKEPWRYEDSSLFWDLNNIAFAHRSCNYKSRRNHYIPNYSGRSKHNDRPPNTNWCRGHKEYLDCSLFSKHKSNYTGYQNMCNECRSKERSPKKHQASIAHSEERHICNMEAPGS